MRRDVWVPWAVTLVLAIIAAVAVTAYLFPGSPTATKVTTSATTSTTVAYTITGQPAGMFLRIITDSGGTLIAGANVTTTHKEADVGSTSGIISCAGRTTIGSFMTDGQTKWYSLNSTNGGNYTIEVRYQGEDYNLFARLSPISVTCAVLFVPSGRTNITTSELVTNC